MRAVATRQRPRGARRLSVQRADRLHCGQPASPRARLRRGARAYEGAIHRYGPDHCAGLELATIDAHRAAEAAADLERRLDDGVAREARRDRFEIRDFAGRAAAGHFLVRSDGCASPQFYADKRSCLPVHCMRKASSRTARGSFRPLLAA